MKLLILIGILVFVLGCTTPGQRMEERISELEEENRFLKQENEVYSVAETKRNTRSLLDQQKNRELLGDTKELMLNMWQTSTFCGSYLLCDETCDYGEYTKEDYKDLCNTYFYSFNVTVYDEIELRLEEALK